MEYIKNQDCLLNESGQFLTEEELLEIDGILRKTNIEMLEKTGEICDILRKSADADYRLLDAYRLAVSEAKKKDAALLKKTGELKESETTKKNLMDDYNLQQQKYTSLEKENTALKQKLDDAALEKDKIQSQISELEDKLSEKEDDCKNLELESKQIREECSRYYAGAREDKEKAEAEQKRFSEALEKEKENSERLEKQYAAQNEKMPALMRLYHAYNSIMEKRGELPQEFFERLQRVMPLDDFDGFLPVALSPSFLTSYYETLQSFVMMCHQSEVGEERMKEALLASDGLLSAIFNIRRKQFKEEGLIRIEVEAGEPYDRDLCKYINEKGGMYGNIARVWLHGFRDEKSDETYGSYVEGE